MNNNKKVLIIVSHPDDEILGCGGTINWHIKKNHDVFVYFTHEGSSSRYESFNNHNIKKDIKLRQNMAKKIAEEFKYKIIGFGNNRNLDIRYYDHLKTTKKIISIINKIRPDTIYTHYFKDLNVDHYQTYNSVISACRPGNFVVNNIYLMEIPSSTDWNINNDFTPNLFININFSKKIKMLSYYDSEMRGVPHPRSLLNIKSLSIIRGGQVSSKNCEGFVVYRIIK